MGSFQRDKAKLSRSERSKLLSSDKRERNKISREREDNMYQINHVEEEGESLETIKVEVVVVDEASIRKMMMVMITLARMINKIKAVEESKEAMEEVATEEEERKGDMMTKTRMMMMIIMITESPKHWSAGSMQHQLRELNGHNCNEKAHESNYGPQTDEL